MKNFIQKQHELGRIFKIIEIGAGVPVASRIMSEAGSSKIMWESESPYSSAKKRFQINCRMVSKEAVETIIQKTPKEDFNNLIVTSFQIPSSDKLVSHGWVGIWNVETDHPEYFHITLNDNDGNITGHPFDRNTCINKIADIVLELISNYDNWQVKMSNVENGFVDNIIFRDDILDSYQLLSQKNMNTLICFNEGVPVRFEDVARKYSQINLYKGSFNPIHNAHKEIAKIAENKYENSKTFFAISRNTYGKGIVSEKDLLKRIQAINSCGYPVLVFDCGYNYDNYYALTQRFSGKIVPIMGADTFNRFMNCYNIGDLSPKEKKIFDSIGFAFPGTRSQESMKISKLQSTYQTCFPDCEFLVFGRDQEIVVPNHIEAKYEYVDFDMKISSTQLRQKNGE